MATPHTYICLQTLADELGRKLFPVKRSLEAHGYSIIKVMVDGQPRDAVKVSDAEAWKAGLNTPRVR